jgi:chromate transporter
VSSTPLATLFLIFLRLGLTSFGGPVAHLGYFRTEFVTRRRWLSEQDFGDIVALCQFLPGPASSQAGIAIGLMRGGLGGAVAAWSGFTLPSALLMIGFAYATDRLDAAAEAKWLHGLLVVAVAVVAQAVWGMSRSFAADLPRATVALAAAIAVLALHGPFVTLAVLSIAALIGWRLLPRASAGTPPHAIPAPWPRWVSWFAGAAFFILLIGLPLIATLSGLHVIALIDRFYRVGALVFGGGHVVLPMLQAEIVPQGWVTEQDFLAGYGAAQAVPGPLFTFAAYLGAVMRPAPNGWPGGLIALAAIFLPSFLMVTAAMPYWTALRRKAGATAALAGVNAAVVGILLAALYTPVWTSAIHGPIDLLLALAGFAALQFGRAPPWSVVLATALAARFLT